jgi:hypothetical protein
MVGLAVVAAAAATCAVQFGIGIKRVIEAGHMVLHQIEKGCLRRRHAPL